MQNDEFANVSWQSDEQRGHKGNPAMSGHRDEEDAGSVNPQMSRHGSAGPLGRNADPLDLAGVGDGVLHCEVSNPIKENDGTKDAYVSYLVTTNVCITPKDQGNCAHLFA
jgi:sorting nexin-4